MNSDHLASYSLKFGGGVYLVNWRINKLSLKLIFILRQTLSFVLTKAFHIRVLLIVLLAPFPCVETNRIFLLQVYAAKTIPF